MIPGQVDVANYQQQLSEKAEFLVDRFKQFTTPTLETYSSQPSNYRLRAEFRVWHQGDDLYHIVFNTRHENMVHCVAGISQGLQPLSQG